MIFHMGSHPEHIEVYELLESDVRNPNFDFEAYLNSRKHLLDSHAFDVIELQKIKEHLTRVFVGEGDETCSICLGKFELESDYIAFPICRHRYHPDCLDAWLSRKANCPVCRRGARSSLMVEISKERSPPQHNTIDYPLI